MIGALSAVDQLLAAVHSSDEDPGTDVPPPLFRPPRLVEAVVADLTDDPQSFRVEDEVLTDRARTLAAYEWQGAEQWIELALRMARLLAGETRLQIADELDVLVRLVGTSRSVAQDGAGSAPEDVARALPEGSPTREVLVHLGRRAQEPAVAYLVLLALHLSQNDPKPIRTVSTSVVLVTEAPFGPTAHTAKLTVEELRNGPAGAVPDPRTMFGLRSQDERLASSVERARHHVDPEGLRSFRWTVEIGEPLLEVDGPSLSAGWAVAAAELTERARRRPRLRAVSERIAITGDVKADGTLGPVDHIDRKAAAAVADRRTGLIFPASASVDLASYRSSQFSPIAVANVASAHHEARSTYDRSLYVVGVACLVVLGLLAAGFAGYRSLEARRREEARATQARELLAEANRLRTTDLRASLLTAYESYKLDPTTAARDLMSEGIGEGSSLRRVLPTASEAVAVAAVRPVEATDPWQAAVLDELGVITFSDVDSGELLASLRPDDDLPYEAIAVNPLVPWIVTATDEHIEQQQIPTYDYDSAPSLAPAVCPGTDPPLLAVSADGSRIAAARGTTACVWNALTGERLAVFDPRLLSDSAAESTEGTGPITALTFGDSGDMLLTGHSGGFDEIDLRTMRRGWTDVEPGLDVLSLAAYRRAADTAETVLVATPSSLRARFPGESEATPLPVGSTEVAGIDTNVDGSVVVAAFGDEVVRLDPSHNFAPSTADDAVSASFRPGIRADIALIDEFDTEVLATLGGAEAVVLGNRAPAQQWASITSGSATGVAVSSDGARVVTFADQSATGYELTPGRRNIIEPYGAGTTLDLPTELDGAQLQIKDAFFQSDDQQLVVFGSSFVARDEPTVPFVRVFDGHTFAPRRDLLVPGGVRRQVVSVIEVGDELLVVDLQGRVTGFDRRSGQQTRTEELGVERPAAMAVSPGQNLLALAWSVTDSDQEPVSPPDGSISFYSYPSMEPTGAPVPAPGGAIWHLEFLDDATLLAHGADEQMYELRSHQGANGQELWQADRPVTREDGRLTADWFDVDAAHGRVLVTMDGDVELYEPGRWNEPTLVLGAGDAAVDLAALLPSGDGLVALAGDDAQLWTLPFDDLLSQICDVVGTGFSEAEWDEHVGNLPFQQRCPERAVEPVVEVASPDIEDLPFGTATDQAPIEAPTASCRDFAAMTPEDCVTYGVDDRSHALVVTTGNGAGAPSLLTQWVRHGDRWEALVEQATYFGPDAVRRIVVPDRPSMGAAIATDQTTRVVVFDGSDAALDEFGAGVRIAGAAILVTKEVWRGEQAHADVDAIQIAYEWGGDGWTATSVAPHPRWLSDIRILEPDGIAGIPVGGRFADAVTAVRAALQDIWSGDLPVELTEWSDGLSETSSTPWTEREPMDLTEACWGDQLCVYGDGAGTLVGWRYDVPSARDRSFGTVASTADRLGLETQDGIGMSTPLWPLDLDALGWSSESLVTDGSVNRFIVGTVRPRGAISALPKTTAMTDVPELAGATDPRDLTLGSTRIRLTVDADLSYRWAVDDDRVEFSEWSGQGPVGVGVYGDDGTLVAAGSLPGPAADDWTLVVCTVRRGVTLTARGPSSSSRRSWLVTAVGLVGVESDEGC